MWKLANAPSDMCRATTPNYFILPCLALSSTLRAPLQHHVHHFTSCTRFESCASSKSCPATTRSFYVQQSVWPQDHMSRFKQQAAVLHGKLQLAVPIITEPLMLCSSSNHTRAQWLSLLQCYSLIKRYVAHHQAFFQLIC